MDELVAWISQMPVASFLRQSGWAYPLLSTVHILAISLIIGSVVLLDLRLTGFFRQLQISQVVPVLTRTAATGVAVALASGFLLFSVQAENYLVNPAFRFKLLLILLALLNVACVHMSDAWRSIQQDQQPSVFIVFCAVMSLLVWVLTVAAGRWIAFV